MANGLLRPGDRRAVDYAALTVIGCVSLFAIAMFSIMGILYLRPQADALTVIALVMTSTAGVMASLYNAMKTRETHEEVRRVAQSVGPRQPTAQQLEEAEVIRRWREQQSNGEAS